MPLDADASAIYYDFIMPTRSMLSIFSVSSIGISFLGVGFASALLAALFFPLFISPVTDEQLHDSVEQAVDYLKGQYSTEYHLIPESPIVCTTRFWLANDNWLAARALTAGGDTDLAPQLNLTVSSLMTQSHGIIEALDGEDISWPPRTPRETPPCNNEPFDLRSEVRDGSEMDDWDKYVDLRMYGAIRILNCVESDGIGEHCTVTDTLEVAQSLYITTVNQFYSEGEKLGFQDEAYDDEGYATYKLALTLLAGARLNEPPEDEILRALLARQADTGGFVTLYNPALPLNQNNTNTETTSYALLALAAILSDDSSQSR